jgi:glycosyltransferase involved in cell wall biosynthesis
MRILYLSLSYVPSRRASSVQVMKMCDAFGRLGHEVLLLTKHTRARVEPGVADPFAFYGTGRSFRIREIRRPGFRGGGAIHALGVLRQLAARRRSTDIAYCRDVLGAVAAAEIGYDVVFEAHGLAARPWLERLGRRLAASPSLRRLVAISSALARELEMRALTPRCGDVVVAADGADPPGDAAPCPPPRGFVAGRPNVGYVGNLYAGRGIELILTLAEREPDLRFHLVGGHADDLRRWQARCRLPNVVFHGFAPPSELFRFYQHLDVVLMPFASGGGNLRNGEDTHRWMSPMKMFEYMAAGVPIVSTDLPVLREVLDHERNALLVPDGSIEDWQQAVKRLVTTPALGRRLRAAARADVIEHFTWDRRANRVLSNLDRRSVHGGTS